MAAASRDDLRESSTGRPHRVAHAVLNPYAVIARDHDALVADAAGNDILRVDEHGNVSLVHVFPNIVNDAVPAPGADFVPTSLALD